MVYFVTGRAGSGKTQFVRNILEKKAKSCEDNMILIVPEQFSFESERYMLENLGPKDALKIEVLSFTRLAECVFSTYGGICNNLIDNNHKVLLMSLALENIKSELVLYSKYVKSTSFIEKMLHICTEFKQRKICPADLISASNNTNSTILSQKIKELSLIFSSYEAYFENSFSDELDILSKLFNILSEHNFFKDKCVVIDAFKGFTAQEFDIISKIMSQAKDIYITLCTDNIFNSTNETDLFSCVNDTAKKLIKIAKDNNISINNKYKLPLDNPTRFKNKELKHLEQNFLNPAFECYEENTENITLCCASTIKEECDYVASTIKMLLRTENLRCKDFAVVARNADTYKSQLISSFEKYDIPYFEDKRQPISSQPIITLVRCLLEICSKGFSTDRIIRYLKTGLTSVSDDEISIIENYALMWDISGLDWTKEWTGHPDGFGNSVTEKSQKTLGQLNKIKSSCISPILKFKNKCTTTNSKNLSKEIYNHLIDIGTPNRLKNLAILYEQNSSLALAQEQERVWDILMDVLNKLAITLNDLPLTISRYKELFDCVLSFTDLGSIPQGLDEITIGSADRIRLSSPKVVFVIGANEGVFPQIPDGKGILNDNDRRNLIQIGLEVARPSEYIVSEENFITYNSVCSASNKLFICYSRNTVAGESLSPSNIVSQIESIFMHCNKVITDELDDMYFIESNKSAFEICAKTYRRNCKLGSTLKNYFNNNEVYSKKLLSLSRVSNKTSAKFDNSEISTNLFGQDMYISPSRIEDYFKCPFAYFCKFGIKAKPQKFAQLDPMQSGTLLHYLLENLIKTHGIDNLSKMSDIQKNTEINNLLTSYINDKMGGLKEKSKRFEYLYFRLSKVTLDVLNRLCSEFENSDFQPVDFELKIDNDAQIKPYEINLDNGGSLKIRGEIDRVDEFIKDNKSYIRIVDYKSGEKVFSLSDVLNGLNLQMLIYLLTVWKNGKTKYGDIIPSGIVYYPAKLKVSRTPRDSTDEDIAKDKIKITRCNGLFLENLEVLNAMENDLKGKFIPITTTKDGSLKGDLINLSQLGKLNETIDNLLREMGESLHIGKIPAFPAQNKSYKDICKYCDYKSVCGFEELDKKRELESIKHSDALTILEKGDDESGLD